MSSFVLLALIVSFIQSSIAPPAGPSAMEEPQALLPHCRPKIGGTTLKHPEMAACANIGDVSYWICEMEKGKWKKGDCAKSYITSDDIPDYHQLIETFESLNLKAQTWKDMSRKIGGVPKGIKICGIERFHGCEREGQHYPWEDVHKDYIELVKRINTFTDSMYDCTIAGEGGHAISYHYGYDTFWECWVHTTEECPVYFRRDDLKPREFGQIGFKFKFCHYPQFGDTPHLHTRDWNFISSEYNEAIREGKVSAGLAETGAVGSTKKGAVGSTKRDESSFVKTSESSWTKRDVSSLSKFWKDHHLIPMASAATSKERTDNGYYDIYNKYNGYNGYDGYNNYYNTEWILFVIIGISLFVILCFFLCGVWTIICAGIGYFGGQFTKGNSKMNYFSIAQSDNNAV